METGLKGKVALVAAASKGLGRAIAEAFAREGMSLAICARGAAALDATAAALRSAAGVPVEAVAADIATTDGIARVAGAALARYGRVDVLVTNAGGPPVGTFETLDWTKWQAALELNLRSAVELTRAVLPGMRERKWGRVIHVTSLVVKQPIAGLMLSTSVRAGLTGFSRTLANEVAADGVTVNTILPGFMSTERVVEIHEATAKREGVPVETVERRLREQIPMRRVGDPRELASLATFLASEGASYITGQSIAADGGWIQSLL